MTVTSGPGLSLMMEHIGSRRSPRRPCVFVDVQRGGPSTGLPTLPAQADMMQVQVGLARRLRADRALSPNSPQECFDLMIKAFNLAEQLPRAGVLHDGRGGRPHDRAGRHPDASARSRWWSAAGRPRSPASTSRSRPTRDMVPEMVKAGDGYRIHVTGLTHDERGYPAMNAAGAGQAGAPPARQDPRAPRRARRRPRGRRRGRRRGRGLLRHHLARRGRRPSSAARRKGLKVGHLRLIIAWPFPIDAHRASWPARSRRSSCPS